MERPDGKSFRAARRIANVLFARLIVEMPGGRQENRAKKFANHGKHRAKISFFERALTAGRKNLNRPRE
jgi:hypothetical protein